MTMVQMMYSVMMYQGYKGEGERKCSSNIFSTSE